MDVREKLVEIVCDAMEADGCIGHCNHPPCFAVERVVNALIAHGVTVQDNAEISDELLEQLRKAPVMVMTEEPTVEVVQEWISVNNMLPKIYDKDSDWSGTVLFRTTQGHIHSGRRKFGRHRMSFWIDESDNLFFSKEEVTHWMPLPQPPKGE